MIISQADGFLPIRFDGSKRKFIISQPPFPYQGIASLLFPSSPDGNIPFVHIVACDYHDGEITPYSDKRDKKGFPIEA